MNAFEVYKTVDDYLKYLRETYGDMIDYLEVYDGQIKVHFKTPDQITQLMIDKIIDRIAKVVFDNRSDE